jgi:NADP-dependent 3-hydroxy acid dehydrogenase YdfG
MTPITVPANTRTLVLTGASRGIGHATVKKFSAGGWRVITVSRQPFSALCPWPGGDKNHVQIDLAEHEDVKRGIEEIRDRLGGGRLDALVNNAAISPKDETGGRYGAIDTPFDLWQRVFNVNFFAPVALARGLMGELSEAKGCVVNVTSIAGSRVHPFAGSAYATSKAALAALTREMAHDFGPRGIRDRAGRDRHRDPVARHRADRRGADPDAPPRHARRSGRCHPLPVRKGRELCQRRRDPDQRRPARLTVIRPWRPTP